MKNTQSLFAAFAFISLFALASCSDSQETIAPLGSGSGSSTDFTQVYGNWKLDSWKSNTPYDLNEDGKASLDLLTDEVDNIDCVKSNIWQFATDNQFSIQNDNFLCLEFQSGSFDGHFYLNLSSGNLTISYDDDSMDTEIYMIKSVSEHTLVLTRTINSSTGGGSIGNGELGPRLQGTATIFTYTFESAPDSE